MKLSLFFIVIVCSCQTAFCQSTADSLITEGVNEKYDGNYTGALADFTAALSYYKDSAIKRRDTYWDIGETQLLSGDFVTAIKNLDTSISISPTYDAYNDRGAAYGSLRQYQRAINDFDSAFVFIRHTVYDYRFLSELYYHRAMCEVSLKEYDKALTDADAAIKTDSSELMHYFERGKIYYLMNMKKEAAGDLNKVISYDTVILYQALALYYTGDSVNAIKKLQQQTDKDFYGHHHLGRDYLDMSILFAAMNQPQNSVTYLKKAADNHLQLKSFLDAFEFDTIRNSPEFIAFVKEQDQ